MHKLPKCDRLNSKKHIENLFKKGHEIYCSGTKALYFFERTNSQSSGLKVLFAVPRKSHKKAVQRNLIRRRLKESYRLHKNKFNEILIKDGYICYLALIYVDKEIQNFKTIENKIILILQRLEKAYDKII